MTVSFDYTRSTGPIVGTFLTGLRDGRLVGARLSDGRVGFPPPEFDPAAHTAITEYVEVGPACTVEAWSWVSEPVAGQPFDRPFAFALVRPEGADTALLHAVDATSPDQMSTGMTVHPVWAEQRVGAITDLVAFSVTPQPAGPSGQADGVTGVVTPVSLDYLYAASPEESAFFRGLAQGRILGQRCPKCGKVYVPPRGACPVDGVPTTDEVELSDVGTVTTFCIVNVPFLGQKIVPPYVSAYVLLDGADIAFLHLILDVPAEEVRMGMRVRAVWKPKDQWGTTIENISHFAPTGEPDADYETYKVHL